MTERQGAEGRAGRTLGLPRLVALCLAVSTAGVGLPPSAFAQSYAFSNVTVEGNQRVEAATIVKFAGIARGEAMTAGALNDAYQRVVATGLFETVELIPSGGTLIIRVTEFPTINEVSFEGNRLIKDDVIVKSVKSQSRRVFSPAQAEADANAIAEAYAVAGRYAARVEPRIIRRADNRVDLVFEIREGRVTEVQRITFAGNRGFSDRRLRQVLSTKQAGILRQFIQRDTYQGERIDLDRQLLTDFYRSRGYIDAQVTAVTPEIARERDAFFVSYAVDEGQRFRIGTVETLSEYEGVEAADYAGQTRIRGGQWYSPTGIDETITRMEGIAQRQGITFLRVEPRITRNPETGTLDVAFVLSKGPRVFVERIDIEGNATTLDQVIRRQFRSVEGDPLNPREIRQAAERIRALGFFKTADVSARDGTNPDQVVVDVNLEEQPSGSLSFGVAYGATDGFGLNVGFTESNFLGRGQYFGVNIATGTDNQDSKIVFIEPAFLNRDLKFKFSANYTTSSGDNESYDTKVIGFSPALEFPLSGKSRLELRYSYQNDEMLKYTGTSAVLAAETAQGALVTSSLGYTYSFDSRISGLNPNAGIVVRFGQDFGGLGGDRDVIRTIASATAQTKVLNEEVTLRATLEGGAISMANGSSRVIDRFSGNGRIRGFDANGIGPRDTLASSNDALGGNYYAVAKFDAEFPIGLPEEYGITGGFFADIGSVWGLDNAGTVDDSLHLRSAIGVSLLWTTPIGPLRLDFAKPIQKESYDKDQTFNLTVSTKF
ncbi:MAG: outer membrane protein assembly factor BamA [Paracoccaceae bacterium]